MKKMTNPEPADNLPPVVSGRSSVFSLESLVDELMEHMSPTVTGDPARLRQAMLLFGKRVLLECQMGFETGAQAGIRQAAALMRDPKHYERKKAVRKKRSSKFLDWHHQARGRAALEKILEEPHD